MRVGSHPRPRSARKGPALLVVLTLLAFTGLVIVGLALSQSEIQTAHEEADQKARNEKKIQEIKDDIRRDKEETEARKKAEREERRERVREKIERRQYELKIGEALESQP